jgi:hypothetical protein
VARSSRQNDSFGGGGGGGGGSADAAAALAVASASFASSGMAFEKSVWHFAAFRDIFLDSYLSSTIDAMRPDTPRPAVPLEKRVYSETYRFLVRVVQDVASRCSDLNKASRV